MALSVADILGPSGSIARRLANYESRPQQLAMAQAVVAPAVADFPGLPAPPAVERFIALPPSARDVDVLPLPAEKVPIA